VVGYALGEGYERWERYATPAGLGLLLALVFLIVGSKLLARRREQKEELQGAGDAHDPRPAPGHDGERD
jgi:hypothetical protein